MTGTPVTFEKSIEFGGLKITLGYKRCSFQVFEIRLSKMFCHLMQNKLRGIDGELEKDRFKSLETRELNDTEKFTSPVLWRRERLAYFIIK